MKSHILLATILLTACATKQPERLPLDRPIYEPPTISMADKASKLHQRIVEDHLNDYGYLLYNVNLPLRAGNNYVNAHNSADLPAWHGNWLMSLAFKQAVEPSAETVDLIEAGIKGLRQNFEVTGVNGLLARAYAYHPSDERDLDFLKKYNPEAYPDNYWMKGQNGFWFRNGVAKGHYQGAMLGLSALIGLDSKGYLSLPPEVRALADATARDLVEYLVRGKYRIQDWNGKPTNFGNLSDYRWNGQSAVQVTAMLRTCALAGSELCKSEYIRITSDNSVARAISIYGNAVKNVFGKILNPTNDLYKPNDTIHATSAALAHYLVSDSNDIVQAKRNITLVDRLADVAGRDRNTFFNFIYVALSSPDNQEELLADGLLTLEMFPDDKRDVSDNGVFELPTNKIYHIGNLKINSHYWKTTWSEGKMAIIALPLERTSQEYSGQDYLGAYWMGRFFGFITKEMAEAPVDWSTEN